MIDAMLAAVLLSLALAMDAFAVALTQGARFDHDWKSVTKIALVFGLFQGVMPLAGWQLGELALPLVQEWDHWIASGLLVLLGVQMIWFGEAEAGATARLSRFALIAAGVATSIDAFAAGVTLPTLGIPPLATCATISIVTAAVSLFALKLGQRVGDRFGPHAEVAGGIVLIGLGAMILVDHLELLA